ncbi:MAG: hypothetical protein JXB25_11030 [Deltaproteobacteria bacterium]|nr:hypothetical protein [Deltaproteobacteria bacterium]
MNNKVVARFADGRIVKGMTANFSPAKDRFHLNELSAPAGSKPLEVLVGSLKALFFVKDFEGNPKHVEKKEFDPARPPAGRRIKVEFRDGEVLLGTTQGYQPGRAGFFLMPADAASNIERCYVVAAAAKEISFV